MDILYSPCCGYQLDITNKNQAHSLDFHKMLIGITYTLTIFLENIKCVRQDPKYSNIHSIGVSSQNDIVQKCKDIICVQENCVKPYVKTNDALHGCGSIQIL